MGEHFRNPIMKPKEVAAALGVSVRLVLNHEEAFGFRRLQNTGHRIYYRRVDVEKAVFAIEQAAVGGQKTTAK